MFPKSFIIDIKANAPSIRVPEYIRKGIKKNLKQRDKSRIYALNLQSVYPVNLWNVLLEEDKAKYKEAKYWKCVRDIAIDDLLHDEPHNRVLYSSFTIQATQKTLLLGAGKRSTNIDDNEVSKIGNNNHSQVEECKVKSPPVAFNVESTDPPRQIYWYLGTNESNLCVVASIVNCLAELGSFELADTMKASASKTNQQIITENKSLPNSKAFEYDLEQTSDEMNKCIVLLRYICKINCVKVMHGKQWKAQVLLDQLENLKHPVLVEIVGKNSVRSHVVCIFDGHILCSESTHTYPCCVKNLNYACGEIGVFDHARMVVSITPNHKVMTSYNDKRREQGLESYEWSIGGHPRKKRKKRKKSSQCEKKLKNE